ncbi:MAG: glutamine synthetase [Gammaproteobacteria bacterium]|jgi:glutamine synthetase|nr:glutamine synthetase [Gammaproteobacteria bacterium]MBT5203977.1 glutamine synthetase [Gammaproteobacteria bacterium]MBT5600809.1 glutamine synthetase [Gammaproteobacteria bacterium]MBT6244554.1 glutamine synthetase [Gammaproteobacteria bacterium]
MPNDGGALIKTYREEGIRRVKLAFTDIDGVMRGKYISLDKFASIADGTSGFCDCVLGWDVNDQLYDNAEFTGWHTAYPDAKYRLDLDSEIRLREEANTPFFIADFVLEDQLHPICPRSRLKEVINRGNSLGYAAKMAFEYEFFVFKETPQSALDKGYQNLEPLSPGNFGYSTLRTFALSDLFNEYMDYCEDHGVPLEGVHCETGPGVWEAAIGVDESLAAADKAARFKILTKAFFQKRGMMATFMAKWSMDYPGQSGHLHQSLFHNETGQSVFYDANQKGGMSESMKQYVAGVQTHMKSLLAITAPTINSYTRLVKGAWAPTAATWGVENRTCALRVIPGSENSQRVEFRVGSADANPYLTAAATLGSGLLGIEKELSLDDPVEGSAYDVQDQLAESLQLPGNLADASRLLAASESARIIFGDQFVNHYVSSRDWEVREYQRYVNDWQLKRYFEII